ncbi:nuclear transport factor 2 family protein [Nocardia sp. NPDC049190]|uniref:nuclear transport factor 2 family protein n=1 Tax=Nocardia sp. NPDC049190 TaxID=3155650 RepID=UPI0033D32A1E
MNTFRRALSLWTLPLAVLGTACTPAGQHDSAGELREALDHHQITALIDRLGRALDEGRFDELRAIYTADATAQTPGGIAEGRDALITQARRNHSADQRIQHLISNVMVDIRGDAADVRANLVATFAPAAPAGAIAAPQFTLGEIYRFDAVRTAQGWRLSRVQTTPLWSTGTRP